MSDSSPSTSAVAFPKPPSPQPSPILDPALPSGDPPPPYPTRDRRPRAGTARSLRRAAQVSTDSGAINDTEAVSSYDDNETTPLIHHRPRTLSHSTVLSTQSVAHTVLSLFQVEPDANDYGALSSSDETRVHRLKRYFRPLGKMTYYTPLFHLLFLNFPYALLAFVFLFVGTLTGTTLLIALPLGALICWFNLVGARAFARGEIALQSCFHGPLAIQLPNPPNPIFARPLFPSSNLESGQEPVMYNSSFLRNTFAMFTDPTSYQAIFYFLVIKPSITLFLTIGLIVVVPVSFALVLPAPAVLRAVKRIGIWQANIAVEGLSRPQL